MHFRKASRKGREVELTEETAARLPTRWEDGHRQPDVAVLDGERRLQVHMTLDLLSSRYRRALTWKYLEDLQVKEIAERLGVSPKAAESVLTRARNAFQEAHARLIGNREDQGTT